MDEVNITSPSAERKQVYARKYRPQILDDLLGQPAVVSSLKNALDSGHIPHSFLFAGPRGVGKTSTARILAKSINCREGVSAVPCNQCDNCREITQSRSIDVLEIDGASHTGVDNIRDLKEKAYNKPVQSRYKLYIVDEVHMLSQSAFNALLKILEEPPQHLLFIFATTEPQKIPETIHSRCQTFRFQRVGVKAIMQALEKVLAGEPDIQVEINEKEEILTLIAEASSGSLRDALVLLEQLSLFSGNKLTLENVRGFFASNIPQPPSVLLQHIFTRQLSPAIKFLHDFFEQGGNFDKLMELLLKEIRVFTFLKNGIKTEEFVRHVQENYTGEILEKASRLPISFYLYFSSLLLKTQEQLKYYQNPLFIAEIMVFKVLYFSELDEGRQEKEKKTDNYLKNSETVYNTQPSETGQPPNIVAEGKNGRNITHHILNNCLRSSQRKKQEPEKTEHVFDPEKFTQQEAWEYILSESKKHSQIGYNLLTFCQLKKIDNLQCHVQVCPNHTDKTEDIVQHLKGFFKALGNINVKVKATVLQEPLDNYRDLPSQIREALPPKYWEACKAVQNMLQGKLVQIKTIQHKESTNGQFQHQ